MNRENYLHVLGGYEALAHGLKEEDVADDCDEAVGDVEDGEDEGEVGGVHGPPLLAQDGHVGVEPVLQDVRRMPQV